MSTVSEGSPEPLGVCATSEGVNVAVYAPQASLIEFCLFDETGDVQTARIALPGRTGPVFHGLIPNVRPGAKYGLRATGPFAPAQGSRFNPHKLLIDPYALSLDRPIDLHPAMFSYRLDDPQGGDSLDEVDSARVVPKAIVMTPSEAPPLGRPQISWGDTVIYELHVRGFTKTHPAVPEALRGTFAGLAHPAVIDHFLTLGVTAVECLPAAAWVDERHLLPLGLTNYWGYNPIAMMAPDPRLAPGGWAEVRATTDALAKAGIECLLDVVFNHTGESDALGPTLCMRGLDNDGYYRLQPGDAARYVNDAGTGSVLALERQVGLRLTMDALRAWRRLGGMAGFRFDLATILGRRPTGFDPDAPLLAAIEQDPELRGLKLIAEPWDLGMGGYQLGAFPPAWGEWNDKFRDDIRGFWRGDPQSLGSLARRLSGSQDVFARKRPSRSVNFVVSHDGFTLADLVSFNTKKNLPNGEGDRDGSDDNRSWNNGVEGATLDPAVLAARGRDQRALLATLLLSRGTPMLSMGADVGHSQSGNNNAYSQDNAISWMNWPDADVKLLAFTARLIAIRKTHSALHKDRFLDGRVEAEAPFRDVLWRRSDGSDLSSAEWDDGSGSTLVMVMADGVAEGVDRVALVFHRGQEATNVVLPPARDHFTWTVLADTSDDERQGPVADGALPVSRRSVLVLGEISQTSAPEAAVIPLKPV